MPKLAANLSTLFTEREFLDRFAAAAAVGFRGVEYLFPYAYAPERIARALDDHDLEPVLFNIRPGDSEAGERGLAGLPGREPEFRETLEEALAYARATGGRRIHVMHGVPPPGVEPQACREVFVANLREAARAAARDDVTLLVEALNPRDNPGYPVNRQGDSAAVVRAVAAQNVRIQFDFYHCQIVEGDVSTRFREHLPLIGHVQIAGVPERHEPDSGELDCHYLLATLDRLGYPGWVGCEYHPATTTSAGLGWAARYGIHP